LNSFFLKKLTQREHVPTLLEHPLLIYDYVSFYINFILFLLLIIYIIFNKIKMQFLIQITFL